MSLILFWFIYFYIFTLLFLCLFIEYLCVCRGSVSWWSTWTQRHLHLQGSVTSWTSRVPHPHRHPTTVRSRLQNHRPMRWGPESSLLTRVQALFNVPLLWSLGYYIIDQQFQTLREKNEHQEKMKAFVFLQDERRSTLSRASSERWDMRRWKDELHRSRKPIQV